MRRPAKTHAAPSRSGRRLRAGALAVMLIAACVLPGAAEDLREVDLELVLAADISGSMDLQEAVLQRQGFVRAFRHPEVIKTIRSGHLGRIAVAYVEWAGDNHQQTVVDWAEVSDARSAEAFARALEQPDVRTALWTSISTVIDFAAAKFEANGYQGLRRVIDISGDGPNNKGEYVVFARDRAVKGGITINGLPIINGRPGRYGFPPMPDLDLYYEDCVIGGHGAFMVVAHGFTDFARAIRRKMVLEIAGAEPPRKLWHRAAERERPPCNAGELQLLRWGPDLHDP